MDLIKYLASIISAALILSPVMINAQEPAPEEPHVCQWTETVVTEPSCTESGLAVRSCAGCGAEQELELPAAGHSYGEPTVSSSCTEPTVETVVCTVCKDEQHTELSPAPGHTWSEWVESEHPCDEDGEKTRTCEVCGEVESETVPAPGHVWSEWSVTDSTCAVDGERIRSCTVCGEAETEIIPAPGHSWGGWSEFILPTCTEAGRERRYCIDCGEYDYREVAALGHRWGEWTVITEPTCTTEGVRTHACTKCPETENEAIPALGHSWSEWTVVSAPTYLEDGEKTRSCTVCAESESAVIEKLANPFTDVKPEKWYTTPILFCLQNGYMVGVSDSAFSLSQPVTRAMIVQIMAKISEADLDAPEYQSSIFVDIADGKWYTSAVSWAYQNGLASGIGQGHFGYKNSITREELALFLMKLTEHNGYGTGQRGALSDGYEDVDRIHSWAYDAVDWALTTGVMHGSTPKHVSPRIPLTRAQVAEIVYDYCTKLIG